MTHRTMEDYIMLTAGYDKNWPKKSNSTYELENIWRKEGQQSRITNDNQECTKLVKASVNAL